MDLILWRHAEAHEAKDGCTDMDRDLTSRGHKQATKMAAWLDRHLPDSSRILASPSSRTEQTVLALGRKYKLRSELGTDGSAAQVLELVQWPHAKGCVLVVGHQPTLGRVVAQLLGLQAGECALKKGSVWWLRFREREELGQALVVTVQSPELL